jgi:hypothetical protein
MLNVLYFIAKVTRFTHVLFQTNWDFVAFEAAFCYIRCIQNVTTYFATLCRLYILLENNAKQYCTSGNFHTCEKCYIRHF